MKSRLSNPQEKKIFEFLWVRFDETIQSVHSDVKVFFYFLSERSPTVTQTRGDTTWLISFHQIFPNHLGAPSKNQRL